MKPRIKLHYRGGAFLERRWRCDGVAIDGIAFTGYGKSIWAAYNDWRMISDIPF